MNLKFSRYRPLTLSACGQQKGYHESYRGVDIEPNLLKEVRLEIAVNGAFLQLTVDAIIKGTRTGEIGDGKILS